MYGQPSGWQPPQAYPPPSQQSPVGYQAPSAYSTPSYGPPSSNGQAYQAPYQAPSPYTAPPSGYQAPSSQPSAYQAPSAAYNPYNAGTPSVYQPPSPAQPTQAYPPPSSPYGAPSMYQPPSAAPVPTYATNQAPSAYQPPASSYYTPPSAPGYPVGPQPTAYQPPVAYATMAPPTMPGAAVGYSANVVTHHPPAYGSPSTTVVTGSPMPTQVVVGSPAAVGVSASTTVVSYGAGTIFAVPSRWTIKQAWGWSDMYIKDEWDNDVFYADAKSYSMTRNLGFTDLRTGIQIAYIKEKLKLGMPKFGIWSGGVEVGTVSQKFTLLNPKFTVQANTGSITITGDWTAHSFAFQRGHRLVANVSKDGCNSTDTYRVTIQPGEDVIFILACCIIIDKCMTYN